MIKFFIGDKVAFHRDVARRTGGDNTARGVVVDVNGPVVSVDFKGTWIKHEDGGTIRHIPAGNLIKLLPNGVVYE